MTRYTTAASMPDIERGAVIQRGGSIAVERPLCEESISRLRTTVTYGVNQSNP